MKRNLYLGLAGLVMLIAIVSSVFVIENQKSSQSIKAEVVAFSQTAPYTVTFEVDKPPSVTVVCEVALISFDDQEVGDVKGLVIGPAKQSSVREEVTIPVTSGTPNQPQVVQCVHQSATPTP